MRAVITAGGESSRFWPLNECHKSMLRIMGKPIIQHVLEALPGAVTEVVVVEPPSRCISSYFASKNLDFHFDLEFRVQNSPNGTWEAILIGAEDADTDFIVLSPYHFSRELLRALTSGRGAKLLLKEVEEPRDYGIAVMEGGLIKGVVEKPSSPPSNLAVVSAYRFPPEFVSLLKKMKSQAEHYLLEKAITEFAKEHEISYEVIPPYEVPSLKYPWHALDMLKRFFREIETRIEGDVAESAVIEGPVIIERGAEVMERAVVKGPAYIGRNAVIGSFSLVRNSDVEENAVVGFCSEVARSIMGRERSCTTTMWAIQYSRAMSSWGGGRLPLTSA